MKTIFNKLILVIFVLSALLLGWGSIFKSLNGLSSSGYYQPQAYYMSLAHI